MSNAINAKTTEEWYKDYYEKKGSDRNDLFRNKEVLFQTLAFDVSVIEALRSTKVNPYLAKVLDVGCGAGGSIINFLKLGFNPSKIYGIDILENRISSAQKQFQNINWICADASNMNFSDNEFDIVFESTMFVSLVDENLSKKIANEMIRVIKPGGYIILVDWRYSKPNEHNYKALSKKRVLKLFSVGERTTFCGTFKGALVPPVGRFLSKYFPFLYFLLQFCFPFLVGQVAIVLRKN